MNEAGAGQSGFGNWLRKLLPAETGHERRCPICSAVYRTELPESLLCPACAAALPRRRLGYCPRCGELAAWPLLPLSLCARCLRKPPPWEGLVFHGAYEGLLRSLLIQLKFHDHVLVGYVLGSLLARHPNLSGLEVDVIAPVPLHRKRLAHRGYNQSLELARPLARRLDRPLAPRLLRRARATKSQSGISREERKTNIREAFTGSRDARGKHVLLVDDTLTTGATMADAARALLLAGAAGVSVAVVGRTALHY